MTIQQLSCGKKIKIWGAGLIGMRVFSVLCNKLCIDGFYDNDKSKWGSEYNGIKIDQWNGKNWGGNELIVIATSFWEEILLQLEEKGLRLFEDYIPYEGLDVFSGGYHAYNFFYRISRIRGRQVSEEEWIQYKGDNSLFRKEYCLILAPSITKIDHKNFPAPGKDYDYQVLSAFLQDKPLMKSAEWYVYNNLVREGYEAMSDYCDRIQNAGGNLLSVTCANTVLYHPQVYRPKGYWNCMHQHTYAFSYCDRFVDELIKEKKSEDVICKMVSDENFLPDKKISKMTKLAIMYMKEADKNSDIKISGFIIEHMWERQLFFSPEHPVREVYIEVADRILNKLVTNHEGRGNEYGQEMWIRLICSGLVGQDVPVYPSVIRYLHVSKYEKRFIINDNSGYKNTVDFSEYVREYIRFRKSLTPHISDV